MPRPFLNGVAFSKRRCRIVVLRLDSTKFTAGCQFNKSQHGLSPDMGGPFGRNGILIYVSTNHNAKVLKHTLPGIREDTPMK